MQFGIENPYFKWSPVQWVYKQWAGLYTKGNQKLYVNPGFGFIGYPGRIGIMPEISVITLSWNGPYNSFADRMILCKKDLSHLSRIIFSKK